MDPTPKRIKRLVREFAGIAHERELDLALRDLHADFERWERRELTAFELNDRIHQFYQGPSRRIWAKYDTGHLEPALASAIALSIVREDELPRELLEHLGRLIEFFEADESGS